jgi:hypothetical protein
VSRRREAHARLQQEIAGEKAAALGRAGERLEAALGEAWDLARRVATAAPGERAALTEAYARARRRAAAARLALVIQREAMGLRHHRVVDQQFPEPPARPEDAGR